MAEPVYCSFCGKSQHEVQVMLAGPVCVFICSDCIVHGVGQVVDHVRTRRAPAGCIALTDPVTVEGVSPYLSYIIGRATREMVLAQHRFPAPNYVLLKVAEEAGELVKAAVHYAELRGTWANVEDEAVQAIAMILRLLDEGDGVNGIRPPEGRS